MSVAIGIDLGTTNTVVASVSGGEAFTLTYGDGQRLIPSVVSFHPSGQVLVGQKAVERRFVDSENTIFSVKRLIGRAWETDDVQRARVRLPFRLVEGMKHEVLVTARGEELTLPEISAFVLRHAKAVAEEALGETVEQAVITVPANFNDLQRAATKAAGKLAGLEVLRILNEPTAAALAYGQGQFLDEGKGRPKDERVAIYDLGGGTFDVTILDLAGNVFEVLSTAGDTALGGDDIDQLIADRMADELLKLHRIDARAHPPVYGALRVAAERLKCELSTRDEYTIDLRTIGYAERGEEIPFNFRMTRPELEWASVGLLDRTLEVCGLALQRAHLNVTDIDHILLVGGCTRMPLVSRKVEQLFKKAPLLKVNPDEVVALGAAIQSSALARRRTRASMVVPSDVPEAPVDEPSIRTDSLVPLPAGAEPLELDEPKSRSSRSPGSQSKQPLPASTAIAPVIPKAPAVPTGMPGAAAIAQIPLRTQAVRVPSAGVLRAAAPLLIDVTPLSLHVETAGGFADRLIETNTPVPCDRTRVFSTASDFQTKVTIRVAQGEKPRFDDNTYLGEVELSGIEPRPRGNVQIAVTFELDADGILNVRARDESRGVEATARLQPFATQHEPDELARMRQRQVRYGVVG